MLHNRLSLSCDMNCTYTSHTDLPYSLVYRYIVLSEHHTWPRWHNHTSQYSMSHSNLQDKLKGRKYYGQHRHTHTHTEREREREREREKYYYYCYLQCSHCCPYHPSGHWQHPDILSQDAPFWQIHLWIQFGPNFPSGQGASHISPVQPKPHWHDPETGSQMPSFWHRQVSLQLLPYLPGGQAEMNKKLKYLLKKNITLF